MYCRKCGTQIPEDMELCSNCEDKYPSINQTADDGVDNLQKKEEVPQNNGHSIKDKKKIRLLSCIIAAVVIIAAVIVLVLPRLGINLFQKSTTMVNEVKPLTVSAATDVNGLKSNIVKVTNTTTDVSGTGFFLENGYLVTASNVVDDGGSLEIAYDDGSVSNASLVYNDIATNMALLEAENVHVQAVRVHPAEMTLDRTYYVIGFDDEAVEPAVKPISVFAEDSDNNNRDEKNEVFQTTAEVMLNSSDNDTVVLPINGVGGRSMLGAPVINERGVVVGFIGMASDQTNYSLILT